MGDQVLGKHDKCGTQPWLEDSRRTAPQRLRVRFVVDSAVALDGLSHETLSTMTAAERVDDEFKESADDMTGVERSHAGGPGGDIASLKDEALGETSGSTYHTTDSGGHGRLVDNACAFMKKNTSCTWSYSDAGDEVSAVEHHIALDVAVMRGAEVRGESLRAQSTKGQNGKAVLVYEADVLSEGLRHAAHATMACSSDLATFSDLVEGVREDIILVRFNHL